MDSFEQVHVEGHLKTRFKSTCEHKYKINTLVKAQRLAVDSIASAGLACVRIGERAS